MLQQSLRELKMLFDCSIIGQANWIKWSLLVRLLVITVALHLNMSLLHLKLFSLNLVFLLIWLIHQRRVSLFINSVAIDGKLAVQQTVTTDQSMKFSGQKRKGRKFIPVCQLCGEKDHIRPRCFTMINFLEYNYLMNYFSRSFPKNIPRPKIDLSDNPRKMWVKKNDLKFFVSFTCLRACATNS